jgi:hypothetical protein
MILTLNRFLDLSCMILFQSSCTIYTVITQFSFPIFDSNVNPAVNQDIQMQISDRCVDSCSCFNIEINE